MPLLMLSVFMIWVIYVCCNDNSLEKKRRADTASLRNSKHLALVVALNKTPLWKDRRIRYCNFRPEQGLTYADIFYISGQQHSPNTPVNIDEDWQGYLKEDNELENAYQEMVNRLQKEKLAIQLENKRLSDKLINDFIENNMPKVV